MSLEQQIERLNANLEKLIPLLGDGAAKVTATPKAEPEEKPAPVKKANPKARVEETADKSAVVSALKEYQAAGGNVPELLGKFGSKNVGALAEADYRKVIDAAKEAA